MKIIQVIPSINNESDGVNQAVCGLSNGLVKSSAVVELHCLGDVPNSKKEAPYKIINYKREVKPVSSIGRSPQMLEGLKAVCKEANVIHVNGLWMMPNIYPLWAIKGTSCKLVVQPHGTLSKWAMKRSWWKKFIIWHLWQKKVLDKADLFVATCEKEYQEIRALGYQQPIAIVPIGMDVAPMAQFKVQGSKFKVPGGITEDAEYTEKLKVQSSEFEVTREGIRLHSDTLATRHSPLATENNRLRRIVFFGRVHKVKAVDHLVKAWGMLHQVLPGWELIIAGPDCGAKAELEVIIADEKIPRVSFVGELNGQAKYDFLTEADIYVLPSHTENFGVTVAEALACGVPVIASQGTPWQGLETERCGRWVPIGVEPLKETLRVLTSLTDDERAIMGERGRAWIQRDFSWEGVGAKMKVAYAWLLGQSEKPDWVRVEQ